MGRLAACALSAYLSWLIYVSGTLHGTTAQEHLAAFLVVAMFFVATISVVSFGDQAMVELFGERRETHLSEAFLTTNWLLQVLLLVITGRMLLAVMRAATEVMLRCRVQSAKRRLRVD